MLLFDGERWIRVNADGTGTVLEHGPTSASIPGAYPGYRAEDRSTKTKRRKRKTMAKRAKKHKAHCKRVKVKKGSRKTRLMCWSASGKIVSPKRSKAGKKAARKRRR